MPPSPRSYCWRSGGPGLSGWLAILAAFTVIALGYGAFGLFLGVLVRSDLEGFFLIIMGGLMDTFLQNPLGNPLADKPVLESFPTFGPTQFAVGGSLGHIALWGPPDPRRGRRRQYWAARRRNAAARIVSTRSPVLAHDRGAQVDPSPGCD